MGYICLNAELANTINTYLNAFDAKGQPYTHWRLQAFKVNEVTSTQYYVYMKINPQSARLLVFDYGGNLVTRDPSVPISKLSCASEFWRPGVERIQADVPILGYTEEDMVAQNKSTREFMARYNAKRLANYRISVRARYQAHVARAHLPNANGGPAPFAGGAWHLPLGFDPQAVDPWANVQGADPAEWGP